VELQVRDARLTDIERITGLMGRADESWTPDRTDDAADVLRQMVYLPNATVIVALDGRMLIGAAVLALRPSVAAGGLVGVVDLLSVEPGNELDGIVEALLQELIRSARNKGCVVLESDLPHDADQLSRWESAGFSVSGPLVRRTLVRATALSR